MRLDCYSFALGMGVPPCEDFIVFSEAEKSPKTAVLSCFGSINSLNA